jgi:hypothetical protein
MKKRISFFLTSWGGVNILLIIFLQMTVSQNYLHAQQDCGVTTPNVQAAYQLYQSYANQPQVAAASALPSKIPVWIYFIEPQSSPMGYNLATAVSSVIQANEYFEGLFEFAVCGSTQIQSDQLSTFYLNNPTFVTNAFNQINALPEPNDDKCVKILFVSALGALGSAFSPVLPPSTSFENSGIVLKVASKKVIAHELGHYFGLWHTFEGGLSEQIVSTDPNICQLYGDFLCDTPADPNEGGTISPDCLSYSGLNDPYGTPYNPDLRNLMSYYWGCSNKFSGEQRAVMRTFFQASPKFEKLRNPDAICVNPTQGNVLAHCLDQGFNDVPLESLKVLITTNSGTLPCTRLTNASGNYPIQEQPCLVNPSLVTVAPRKSLIANDGDPAYLAPTNGLTAFDLILMSQQILNIAPFGQNPYKYIAADVNGSGTVTSFDIITARQVLLGSLPDFPVGSWRYVPNQWFEFPTFYNQFFNTNNPLAATAVDPISLQTVGYNTPNSWMDNVRIATQPGTGFQFSLFESNWSFTGVKVGDIDCTGTSDALTGDNPINSFVGAGGAISIPGNAQNVVEVIVSSPVKIAAWQMGIDYSLNKLTMGAISAGNTGISLTSDDYFKEENNANSKGKINLCWFSETGTAIGMDEKCLFKLAVNSKLAISNLEYELLLNQGHLKTVFFDESGNQINGVKVFLKKSDLGGIGMQTPIEDRSDNIVMLSAPEIQVNPIPFGDAFVVNIQSPSSEPTMIKLLDVDGKEVYSTTYNLMEGKNSLEIFGLQDLPYGVYALIVQNKSFAATKKIIK